MNYGLIYSVSIPSLRHNNYTLEIEKKGYTGINTNVKGGSEPFVTTLDDDDFVYLPLRLSTAKLSVVGTNELSSLFATEYQEYRVTLKLDAQILWRGFIKPELYTQDYTATAHELGIECLSAITVLEHINYTQVSSSGLVFVSLKNLIERALTATNSRLDSIYIPHTFSADSASYGTSALLRDDCLISEQNFFDEENKAMNFKDILEEICRFSHTTLYDDCGSLYFVDHDYTDAYDEYNLINGVLTLTTANALTINTKSVQSIGFGGSDHSLDIIAGYNKASVVTSNYNNISKVFPTEDWDTLTKIEDMKSSGSVIVSDKIKPYHFRRKLLEGTIYKAHYYAGTGYTADGQSTKELTHWPFNYGTIYETATEVSAPTQYIYNRSYNTPYFGLNYGAYIAQYADYLDEDVPINYDFANAILLHKYMQYDDQNRRTAFDPKAYTGFLTFRNHLITAIFSDGAIILSAQVRVMPPSFDCMYTNFDTAYGFPNFPFNPQKVTLTFMLRIGSRYFNGSTWTDTVSMFNVDTETITSINSFTALKSNKTLDMPYNGATGYLIPITGVEKGEVFFAIMDTDNNCAIKDLKLDFQVVDDYVPASSKDDNSSDRKYSNVVNGAYINELDEIEEKISSYNHDGLCYSKLLLGNDFIKDNLYEGINQVVTRPEELLLRRIVNQYSGPKIKLTQVLIYDSTLRPIDKLTDNFQQGKKFVVTGREVKYRSETMNTLMMEKE